MFLLPYLDLILWYSLAVYCFLLSRRINAVAVSTGYRVTFFGGGVVPVRWSGRR